MGRANELRTPTPLATHANPARPSVIAFVGPSGAGKTTLLEKLIALLSARGLRVGALKHDAHEFQMDREGKDTWRFGAAGAEAVGIASARRSAILVRTERAATLDEMVAALPAGLDIVLVEGYRGADVPKVEVHRRGAPLLHRAGTPGIVAIVTDDEHAPSPGERFSHDDPVGLAHWLARAALRDA